MAGHTERVTTDEDPAPPTRRGVRLSELGSPALDAAFKAGTSAFATPMVPQLNALISTWKKSEAERLQNMIGMFSGQALLGSTTVTARRLAEATRPQLPNMLNQTVQVINAATRANLLLAMQPMSMLGTSLAPSMLQMSSVVETALKGVKMAGGLKISQDYLLSQLGTLGGLQESEVRRMVAWTARNSGIVPASQSFARTRLLGLAPLVDPDFRSSADEDDDEVLEVLVGDHVTIEYLVQTVAVLEREVNDLRHLEKERERLAPAPESPEARAIRERGERAVKRRLRFLSIFGLILYMWLNGNVPEATKALWDAVDTYEHLIVVAGIGGVVGGLKLPERRPLTELHPISQPPPGRGGLEL